MRSIKRKFRNRREAGRLLADQLQAYQNQPDVLVLGLPRGGVPVAFEIAQALQAPLDICLVQKLGVPDHAELAMGAIASGGVRVLNNSVLNSLGITNDTVDRVAAQAQQELQRRDRLYRGDRPEPDIQGQTIILVDDGVATGSTMRAALEVLQAQQPGQLIVAIPVAPPEVCLSLKAKADEVICLVRPAPFHALSFWYEDFDQMSDDTVQQLLAQTAAPIPVA